MLSRGHHGIGSSPAALHRGKFGRGGHQSTDGLGVGSGYEHGPQRQVGPRQRLEELGSCPVAVGTGLLDQAGALGDVVVGRLAQQHPSVGDLGGHAS